MPRGGVIAAAVFNKYYGVIAPYLTWTCLAAFISCCLLLIILIRITVPRLKLESLSRAGWATLLGLLGMVIFFYATVFLFA